MAGEWERRPAGRSGLDLPVLGFGGAPIGGLRKKVTDASAAAAVEAAWQAGLRYFDTAPLYGHGSSERRLGRALAGRPRGDFLLSTKVGRLLAPSSADPEAAVEIVFDYSYDGAKRSLESSLERLGLERVDIALIHDIDDWTHGSRQPELFAQALDGAYRALADLRSQGVIRAIGLGLNEWEPAKAFAERAPIDLVLLAGRYTLLEQGAARTFLPFCLERGIGVVIGGPFNSGILATGAVAGALYDYLPPPPEIQERVRRLAAVCARHEVPLAAAALAFPLRHAAVTCLIPGMVDAAEVGATTALARAAVPQALWADLAGEGLIEDAGAGAV
jgi:D-threo-aldose 1-dehydrogenase